MKNMRHPNFMPVVISLIMLLTGVAFKLNGYRQVDYIIIASVAMGAIHWIRGIIDVIGRKAMKPFQKCFWLIAVVAPAAIGGLIFQIMRQEPNRLTT